jgi:hypothetical protein
VLGMAIIWLLSQRIKINGKSKRLSVCKKRVTTRDVVLCYACDWLKTLYIRVILQDIHPSHCQPGRLSDSDICRSLKPISNAAGEEGWFAPEAFAASRWQNPMLHDVCKARTGRKKEG